jgi:4'-phosphopantetheinyl transferase
VHRPAPRRVPPLGSTDCQVWWVSLASCQPAHERLLDPVESARRAGYRARADRDRFTLGVVVTRTILAANLGVAPDKVDLDRTCATCGRPHGRPRPATGVNIDLSVSHSGDFVVVAFAVGRAVGIDVERLDRSRGTELAKIVLSPAEHAHFSRLEPAGRSPACYRYWVRKEALLKASGDGLRVPLTDLTVSASDEHPRLVEWAGRPELSNWVEMLDLHIDSTHAASVAVIGERTTVHEYDAGPLIQPSGSTIGPTP